MHITTKELERKINRLKHKHNLTPQEKKQLLQLEKRLMAKQMMEGLPIDANKL